MAHARRNAALLSVFWLVPAVLAIGQAPPAGGIGAPTYEYREDLFRVIWWKIGGVFILGKFDKGGAFVPFKLPGENQIGYSGPQSYDPSRPRGADRTSEAEEETVYEFRSGFLIPGTLLSTGDFIPKEGEKVIAFKDYHDPEKEPRIYNLPGYFVRIENGKVTRKIDPAP